MVAGCATYLLVVSRAAAAEYVNVTSIPLDNADWPSAGRRLEQAQHRFRSKTAENELSTTACCALLTSVCVLRSASADVNHGLGKSSLVQDGGGDDEAHDGGDGEAHEGGDGKAGNVAVTEQTVQGKRTRKWSLRDDRLRCVDRLCCSSQPSVLAGWFSTPVIQSCEGSELLREPELVSP